MSSCCVTNGGASRPFSKHVATDGLALSWGAVVCKVSSIEISGVKHPSDLETRWCGRPLAVCGSVVCNVSCIEISCIKHTSDLETRCYGRSQKCGSVVGNVSCIEISCAKHTSDLETRCYGRPSAVCGSVVCNVSCVEISCVSTRPISKHAATDGHKSVAPWFGVCVVRPREHGSASLCGLAYEGVRFWCAEGCERCWVITALLLQAFAVSDDEGDD